MKTFRVCAWLDTITLEPAYGVECGRIPVTQDGKLLLFRDKHEAAMFADFLRLSDQ